MAQEPEEIKPIELTDEELDKLEPVILAEQDEVEEVKEEEK